MSLSYPLSLPGAWKIRRATMRARAVVGVSESPFTRSQQVYAHQGDQWALDVQLVPLDRADAEDCIALLTAMNGMEGTVLMPAPGNSGVRGSWAGAPVVSGAQAARIKSLPIKDAADGATFKAGDYFQLGSGSTATLHKVVQDMSVSGSPTGFGTLEIWPRTRASLSDGAAITIVSPMGRWRLASNEQSWDIEIAQVYGITAAFVEDLSE
jgi:hypothetical protein